jgi:hemerythrin-like domain-containing protein
VSGTIKMLPIDALMQEHRIIERMIPSFKKELARMEESKDVNVKFIETAVDFIRTYADHCHHGKEEGILFRELRKKPLSNEHVVITNQLIEEHAYSRKSTSNLAEANTSYINGNAESWKDVSKFLKELIEFYPKHIEKEDMKFFYPSMEYFSPQEREAMLTEFWDFDKKLIHEKYERVVSELEKIAAKDDTQGS